MTSVDEAAANLAFSIKFASKLIKEAEDELELSMYYATLDKRRPILPRKNLYKPSSGGPDHD